MMLSVFIALSSARRDDEGVVRSLRHRPEIGGGAAPDAGDRVGCAALVDTQPAIDPVDLAAVLVGFAHHGADRILWDKVVFLLSVAAVERVGVRLLRRKRLQD